MGLADTYASLRIEIGSAYTILFFIMTSASARSADAMARRGCDRPAQRGEKTRRCISFEVHHAMKLAPVPIGLTNARKRFAERACSNRSICISTPAKRWCCSARPAVARPTLRMIAGLETPDAGGRIAFGDDDVTALPIETPGRHGVPELRAVPNLTVRGNIGYGLKINACPRSRAATRRRIARR